MSTTAPTVGQYVTYHDPSGDRLALVTGVTPRTISGGVVKGHDGDDQTPDRDRVAYDLSLHVAGSTTSDVQGVRQGNSAGEWEPLGS